MGELCEKEKCRVVTKRSLMKSISFGENTRRVFVRLFLLDYYFKICDGNRVFRNQFYFVQ
jgi:hypothetical protein